MEIKKTIIVRKLKCNICKYEWTPRVKNPLQCPNCKRMDWNKRIKKR